MLKAHLAITTLIIIITTGSEVLSNAMNELTRLDRQPGTIAPSDFLRLDTSVH